MAGDKLSQRIAHVLFALAVVAALVTLRLVVSEDRGLERLHGFESMAGVDVGPDHDYFGNGLNGDAATITLIALDPLGADVGRSLFEPAYRYTRLAVPWMSALVTLGNPDLVLLGLSVIGLASVGGLAYLASRQRHEWGRRSWLLIANPALVQGALGDTTEAMALFLLAVSMLTGSLLLAVATGLTRESYLPALAGRPRQLIAGLASVLAVRAVWAWRLDDTFLSGSAQIDWPLMGILENPSLLGWLVTAAGLATAVVGFWKRDLGWIAGGAFVLLFAAGPFHTPTNAVRAAGYLPVLWAFGPNWKPSRATTQASHVVDDH
jgi:hypothetical protein